MFRFLIVTTIAFMICAAPARAEIIFYYSSGGDFQNKLNQLGATDHNVLFNGSGVVNGPALTVTGLANGSGQLVNITSSELLTGVGGQAPAVQSVDGTFANATIAFSDANTLMQSLFFNLGNTNSVADSLVRLTVRDQLGQTEFTEVVNNGQNFFGVIAFNGQSLVSANVQVLSSSGGTDVLDQMKQIRISGVPAPTQGGGNPPPPPGPEPVHTPEPQSVLLWGLCASGAAIFMVRRFRVRTNAA